MSTQKRITEQQPLLNDKGGVLAPGYATRMVFDYQRSAVKGRPFGLKEWDFYQISMPPWVLQMTIGHVSYATNAAATLFSTKTGERYSYSAMLPFRRQAFSLLKSPDIFGKCEVKGRAYAMSFISEMEQKLLSFHTADGQIDIEMLIPINEADEEMVIATPFFKDTEFYLNCKRHFYGVKGFARFGNRTVCSSETDTALLDFGRGVWPFNHEWYWACACAYLDIGRFGFNFGWGFGNLSAATENMLFLNGKAYKLGTVKAERDQENRMAPWHFYDEDGMLDLLLTPEYDNATATKLLFVNNSCHQLFGCFDGQVCLPEGGRMNIHQLKGFCEHAVNRW